MARRDDFRFGAKRAGTPEFLCAEGARLGFTVEIVERDDEAKNERGAQICEYLRLDAQGKIIVSGNFMERTTISTAILPAGIYVIKIRQGPSFEYFKIMKSK